MQTGRTGPQEIQYGQSTTFPGNQILTFVWRIDDQEQASCMADYFASSVVSTRKTRYHLVAFHD